MAREIKTCFDTGRKYIEGKKIILYEDGCAVNKEDKKPLDEKYDFSYACSTGNLRRKRRSVKKFESATQDVVNVADTKTIPETTISSAPLIIVVMTIVGIGSAIMSAYHTSTFLYAGGKPAWTSIMTGVMLILFSGTSFTAARYFFKEGGMLQIFGVLFIVAGFAVICYSMFSTLTVNFEQFKWRDNTALQNSEIFIVHDNLLDMNQDLLKELSEQIERLQKEAEYWRTMSWRRYDEINVQLAGLLEQRNVLRSELTELFQHKPDLATQAQASQETIYTFLGRLFRLNEDSAKFLVYVLPACLYDILAPFALSVVLFLIDKNKYLIFRRRRCL